jgi:hypothetical protein
MEPNPLAALAPPPEELKTLLSRSRYGLGSRSLDDYLDPTGPADTADPGVVAPDVARSARSHAVAPSI